MLYILVAVALLVTLTGSKYCGRNYRFTNNKCFKNYDYIVVGAGSAGCIVAGRLSENQCNKILLIEAGDNDLNYPDIQIPYNARLLSEEGLDWKYKTEAQKYLQGINANKSIVWSRGKVLGGSGNTNYMGYDRGSRATFDLWGQMASPQWNYNNVLSIYKKMESYHDSSGGYRGTTGPLTITDVNSLAVGEAFIKAGVELGYKHTDTNGKDQIGFMLEQTNIKNGRRWSSSFAYLHPSMNKTNLKVLTNTLVTKILFRNKLAVGVEVLMSDGKKKIIRARKEIILSAGMIASPQILMLSGIGPKKHLEKLKIPVIADLPVGKNLQEQLLVSYPFITDKKLTLHDEARTPENERKWRESGEGPLASQGTQGRAFIHSLNSQLSDPPHLEIFQKIFSLGCKNRSHVSEEEFQFYEAICRHAGFHIFVLNTQPKGYGEIRLHSNKPKDYPIIDFQYLDNPEDLEILADGLMFLCKMNETQAFKEFKAYMPDITYPACKNHNVCTREYFKCYAKHFASSMSHASGTCKMGNDDSAVVNAKLKVRGIKRLRVCDASIFPTIPSASINGPAMMVGEKCSEFIMSDD